MNENFPRILEIGDHVWYEIGGPIGLVIDVRLNEIHQHQEVLVHYYWGKAYWYKSADLYRTRSPLSK